MTFARPQYLVETEWLAQHLDDPSVRVLECTVYLHPKPEGGFRAESGRAKWAESHIPGAGFADLTRDLSDRTSSLNYMMPPAEQFAEVMGRLGVGAGVRVILYDRAVNMWAARVWWMLRAFGFDAAAVLNGGWKKWTGENRPVAPDAGTLVAGGLVLQLIDQRGLFDDAQQFGRCARQRRDVLHRAEYAAVADHEVAVLARVA